MIVDRISSGNIQKKGGSLSGRIECANALLLFYNTSQKIGTKRIKWLRCIAVNSLHFETSHSFRPTFTSQNTDRSRPIPCHVGWSSAARKTLISEAAESQAVRHPRNIGFPAIPAQETSTRFIFEPQVFFNHPVGQINDQMEFSIKTHLDPFLVTFFTLQYIFVLFVLSELHLKCLKMICMLKTHYAISKKNTRIDR